MGIEGGTPGATEPLPKLQAEYWSKRLDHTLTHTQTSSRLIYLVDGAVLALIYFVLQAFGASRQIVGFVSIPVFLLVALNTMHALLIKTQAWWYHQIDVKLATLLKVERVERTEDLLGTHDLYQRMHWLIAGTLFLMALLMVTYWFGGFPDVPMRPAASAGRSVSGRGDR